MKKFESLNSAAFQPMEVNSMIEVKGGYGTGAGARAIEGNLIRFSRDTIDMTSIGPILTAYDQNGKVMFEMLDL